MELRNWIGIIMIFIGSGLLVSGFYGEQWLLIISFILIFLGAFIFATQRYIARAESREFNYGPSNKNTSLPLMGDINNVSGQRTGGRQEESSFSSSMDSGGGDGD